MTTRDSIASTSTSTSARSPRRRRRRRARPERRALADGSRRRDARLLRGEPRPPQREGARLTTLAPNMSVSTSVASSSATVGLHIVSNRTWQFDFVEGGYPSLGMREPPERGISLESGIVRLNFLRRTPRRAPAPGREGLLQGKREGRTVVLRTRTKSLQAAEADPSKVSSASLVASLPRGCQACLSRHSFDVRERLEHVLQINLEQLIEIIETRAGIRHRLWLGAGQRFGHR